MLFWIMALRKEQLQGTPDKQCGHYGIDDFGVFGKQHPEYIAASGPQQAVHKADGRQHYGKSQQYGIITLKGGQNVSFVRHDAVENDLGIDELHGKTSQKLPISGGILLGDFAAAMPVFSCQP